MHFILFGFLLGLGAAVPIGPVNLEIARRNLQFGFWHGVSIGIGAVVADVCYLSILSVGAIRLLQHQLILYWVNLFGSVILVWFGIQALRSSKLPILSVKSKSISLPYQCLMGFGMTLLNPYTILFWASVSTQTAAIAQQGSTAMLAGIGVILGTLTWVIVLNSVLHWSRRFLSPMMGCILNITGGIILLAFAGFGFLRSLALMG